MREGSVIRPEVQSQSLRLKRPAESFHQSQESVPGTGGIECVTTTAVVSRNIMNELLADMAGRPPLPDLRVEEYVLQLDALGWPAWLYRVPSGQSPLSIPGFGRISIAGWMHPTWQLPRALRRFAAEFRAEYGCSFEVSQAAERTLDDLAAHLRNGHLVIVHGLYPATDPGDPQSRLGGKPHTMGPVLGLDAGAGTIAILDTGPSAAPNVMDLKDFQAWWGRRSTLNAYTRPNTLTVMIPHTARSSG